MNPSPLDVLAQAFGFRQKALTQPNTYARIQADGKLLPASQSGVELRTYDWSTERAVAEGYKRAIYVYRCIKGRADSVAAIPFVVNMRKTDKGEWEKAPDNHPLVKLLDRPNQVMSRRRWLVRVMQALDLNGNSLSRKTILSRSEPQAQIVDKKRLGSVSEIWPQPIVGFSPIPNRESWLEGYKYQAGGVVVTIPREEMIHEMHDDPSNPYWGMSPLQPGAQEIDTNTEAINWNRESMYNRTVDGGVMSYKGPGVLQKEEFDLVVEMLAQTWSGSRNAHRPRLIGGPFDWASNTRSPVEMDFVEGGKKIREDILSLFGVPPVVAGFFDQATLANAEVSIRLFMEGTIVPLCEQFADTLRAQLLPHFGDPATLWLDFDYDQVPILRADLGKKTTIFVQMLGAGVSFNEAAEVLEMPFDPIDGVGDLPFGVRPPNDFLASPDALTVSDAIGSLAEPKAPAAVPSSQDVQVSEAAVLNGAQIQAATGIVAQVAAGEIPRDSGLGQLQVLFNLTPQQAESIMGSAGTSTPTTPNPNPAKEVEQSVAPRDPVLVNSAPLRFRKKAASLGLSIEAIDRLEDQGRLGDAIRTVLRNELRAVLTHASVELEVSALSEAIVGGSLSEAQVLAGLPQLRRQLEARVGVAFDSALLRAAKVTERMIVSSGRGFALDEAALRSIGQAEARRLSGQLVDSTMRGFNDVIKAWRGQKFGNASAEDVAKVLRHAAGANGNQLNSIRAAWEKLAAAGQDAPIEKLQRLGRAMVRQRVDNVATNEGFGAVHKGELAAWRQAISDGVVKSVRKTWVDGDDGSVCPICVELDGQERDIGEDYVSGVTGERYDSPPAPHPECRCGQLLEIRD